jgi:hypothetical protein
VFESGVTSEGCVTGGSTKVFITGGLNLHDSGLTVMVIVKFVFVPKSSLRMTGDLFRVDCIIFDKIPAMQCCVFFLKNTRDIRFVILHLRISNLISRVFFKKNATLHRWYLIKNDTIYSKQVTCHS